MLEIDILSEINLEKRTKFAKLEKPMKLTTLLTCMFVTGAQAVTMFANYDFANNDGVSAVTGGEYSVTANDLTISTTQFDFRTPIANNQIEISAADTDGTTSAAGPDYFEFSLDFSGQEEVTLYTVNLQVNATQLFGSLTDITLFASTDGFVTSQLVDNYDTVLENGVDQDIVFGLGSMTDRTFESGESVTFRVELKDIHGLTSRTYRFDDIQVFGIPEPTSLSLLGLGGLVLVARRKRA